MSFVESRRRPVEQDGKKLSALLTVTQPSIVPIVALPAFGLGVWAAVVVVAWYYSPPGQLLRLLPSSSLLITLLGVVMGLLLVFRTNTAYDRFYEGRRVWAVAQAALRSLARMVWVGVRPGTAAPGAEEAEAQQRQKRGAMFLLVAFAAATKHHMRYDKGADWDDLGPWLQHVNVKDVDAPLPLEIVFRLQKFIHNAKSTGQIDANIQLVLSTNTNTLMDCFSTFERIRSTPIPLAYELHLKQTLVVYLLSLPFQLVTVLNWYTIPATMVAAFTMFGIEAIGGQIENPFGFDANDLPQDEFVDQIRDEVLSVMAESDGF
ncbi:hypothetical protein HDU98_001220 [Podochytrium sp. JEL0797]|nr:hypothetical protein HDU98_001220 [Podochytrium sp. JEL0797]